MAKSENNEVMFGARGKVGNLVTFKNYYGRTIIAKRAIKKDTITASAEQELVKERFKEGVYYAKGVLQDEQLSSFYKPFEKGPVKTYNLALADFCRPPEIKSINIDHYQGNIGDDLKIRAVDNFQVVSVKVTISKDGVVVESGMAVQEDNRVDWTYTATEAITGTGISFLVQATDAPGNVTTQELIAS